MVLAGVTAALAPGAGYLWTLPLLVAGLGLLAVPATNATAIRAISVVVLAVAGTLWLRDTVELLRFMVALLGRMPFITPVWVYAALMLACGAMVGPAVRRGGRGDEAAPASVDPHGGAARRRGRDGRPRLCRAGIHLQSAAAAPFPRAHRAGRLNVDL